MKKRPYCVSVTKRQGGLRYSQGGHWMKRGSLKPMSLRKLSMSSLVASGGIKRTAGSPVKWRMMKMMIEIPNRTRRDCQRRRVR